MLPYSRFTQSQTLLRLSYWLNTPSDRVRFIYSVAPVQGSILPHVLHERQMLLQISYAEQWCGRQPVSDSRKILLQKLSFFSFTSNH